MDELKIASQKCEESHRKMESLAFGGAISENRAEDMHENIMLEYRLKVIRAIDNKYSTWN